MHQHVPIDRNLTRPKLTDSKPLKRIVRCIWDGMRLQNLEEDYYYY
jgi:hypothetical protein